MAPRNRELMAIGASHVDKPQDPLTVMAMCFHRVTAQLELPCAQVVVTEMRTSTTGKTRNATRKRR